MTQAEDTRNLEIRTSRPLTSVVPGARRLRVKKAFHPAARPESEAERFIMSVADLGSNHDIGPAATKPGATS